MRHEFKIRFAFTAMLLIATGLLLTGCGGGGEVETDPGTYVAEEFEGAPQWVTKGRGEDNQKIYGLGSFAGSRDVGLARDTALARARNDIVLRIQAEVRSLLESYQATTTGGSEYGEAANDEQHVENMIAQVAKMDVSGAGMEEQWISRTGTMWVLAAVDIEEFSKKVNQMSQLNEQIRQDIVERARDGQGRLWEKTGD